MALCITEQYCSILVASLVWTLQFIRPHDPSLAMAIHLESVSHVHCLHVRDLIYHRYAHKTVTFHTCAKEKESHTQQHNCYYYTI